MSSLDFEKLPYEERDLYVPPLEELAEVLNRGLAKNFAEVRVEVVDCPDLTQEPFGLVSPGISGNPKLIELGGPPYLVPLVQRDKLYDLARLARFLRRDPAALIGAGAGPWPHISANCEGIINLRVEKGSSTQGSRLVSVSPVGGAKGAAGFKVTRLPHRETRTALLGNYLISDGAPGKVLKVVARNRVGELNFITSIRETLNEQYKERIVGLGGTFVLREGKVKHHVMPDFSATPLQSDDDVNSWLHFFELPAPIMHVGTLVSADNGLDLRLQHFHGYGPTCGGHYHYDVTPAQAHYEGYFTPAAAVCRLDRPPVTHQMGRD